MLTRAILCATLAGACVEYEETLGEPRLGEIPPPAESTSKLDVLFVIDNSGSMGEEQTSLAANFHRFMDQLDRLPGGRPDVHVGIVSPNVGVLGNSISPCLEEGDDGILQATPRVSGCTPPAGYFITDHASGDGTRETNYAGTLGDTFACIAQLGTDGCGFEQHFEAMRRALDGSRPENTGFLREDAYLAVVFIADEDDCSAMAPELFDPESMDLGPTTSFRCVEYALTCDGAAISRIPASYESCEPWEESPFVVPVGQYVEFLRSLKSSPAAVIPTAIVGDPKPFVVELDDDDNAAMQPSCSSASGTATPGIRFRALVEAFPAYALTSICQEDLSAALELVGGEVRAALEAPEDPPPPEVSHGCAVSRGRGATASLAALLALLALALRRRPRP